ncbi:MAG TPA: efflux RND transporter periplasmic adaptor subunit, partial [Marinobacter sp.]|nr:efflux RND transporter periplasmic adaptor subunit [Marinobacter sp.]
MKQWLIAVLLLVAALMAAWLMQYYNSNAGAGAASARERAPTLVAVAFPKRTTVSDRVKAVGNLQAEDSIAVTTELSGRVVQLNLEPGQRVAKGDVLLRFDDRQAQADLQVIEARLADAKRQYDRARQLSTNNNIAIAQMDELRTAADVLQAQRLAARVHLENHRISAPFAGVIGLSDISLGAYVSAGTRLATLDSTRRMELNFSIPDRYLGLLTVGLAVQGESPAYPGQSFGGELVALDSRVSELNRSLAVRALIDNADGRLRPGQFMSASLTLQQREALVIPEQAVIVRGDNSYVFVAEDGIARRLVVSLGARSPGQVEVTEG